MSHFIVLGKFLYFPLFSFAFLRLSSRPRGCSGAGFIVRPWGGGRGGYVDFFLPLFTFPLISWYRFWSKRSSRCGGRDAFSWARRAIEEIRGRIYMKYHDNNKDSKKYKKLGTMILNGFHTQSRESSKKLYADCFFCLCYFKVEKLKGEEEKTTDLHFTLVWCEYVVIPFFLRSSIFLLL